MSNLLIMGGFTESRRMLEPVAEEAVRQGLGHDAEVLTLRAAVKMEDMELRKAMAGAAVLTHSAGLMAVPDARRRVSDSELPEDLFIVAGPEPRSIPDLEARANRKTRDHLFGPTEHKRRAHLRVVAGNAAELIAHPVANTLLIPRISHVSTVNRMDTEQVAAADRLGSFMMEDDIFYADRHWRSRAAIQDMQADGTVFAELPGSHDELLIDAAGVISGIGRAFGSPGFVYRQPD